MSAKKDRRAASETRRRGFRREGDELSGNAFDVRLARRMLRYVRPYRRQFWLGLLAVMLASFLSLVPGELVKRAIDGPIRAALAGSAEAPAEALDGVSLLPWALGVMVCATLAAVFQVFHVRWNNRVAQNAMRDLRVEAFSHVQSQSLRFFDRNPVGRLVTRAVNDVEALSELLVSGFSAVFQDILLLVGIVVWLMLVDVRVAAAGFVLVPPLVLVTQLFRASARRAFRLVRERLAAVNANIQESISGVRVVQAFAQEEKCARRFFAQDRELADAHLSTVKNFALFFPTVELFSAVGKSIVIWLGASRIVSEAMTFGELTQFVFYLELFFRPIRDIAEKFNVLQGSMASAERLFRLLDRAPDLTSPENPVIPERLAGDVRFDDVTFGYLDDEPVLEEIEFHVRPGETVALVGATGAGKTTVASLVTRLYDVDRGSVRIDGHDVRALDLGALRSGVTVVPQDVFLFAGTVEDNLRMGDASLSREALLDACRAVGADRVLARLPDGLATPVGERGGRLSVGERQLLALARALAQDPAVLILDEATSSVDSETEHLIQQALDRLQEGRTTLVIAHRLSTVRKADRILVFHRGRLRESGTHDELVESGGVYATLHRLQFAA